MDCFVSLEKKKKGRKREKNENKRKRSNTRCFSSEDKKQLEILGDFMRLFFPSNLIWFQYFRNYDYLAVAAIWIYSTCSNFIIFALVAMRISLKIRSEYWILYPKWSNESNICVNPPLGEMNAYERDYLVTSQLSFFGAFSSQIIPNNLENTIKRTLLFTNKRYRFFSASEVRTAGTEYIMFVRWLIER